MSEPRTIAELADELRHAYFGDPQEDELLQWDNCLPIFQNRWLQVAERANEFSRRDLEGT